MTQKSQTNTQVVNEEVKERLKAETYRRGYITVKPNRQIKRLEQYKRNADITSYRNVITQGKKHELHEAILSNS
jgi:hypothetical protein